MEKVIHIIPTPIGNLEDITIRALRILKESDLILAEDTRVTRKLFNHYDIKTKMSSYHAFNEHNKLQSIISQIHAGEKIALVSDAGMPGIWNINRFLETGAERGFPEYVISGF